jgi:hypothetical protein
VKLPSKMRYLRLYGISPKIQLDLSECFDLDTLIFENGNEYDEIIFPQCLFSMKELKRKIM